MSSGLNVTRSEMNLPIRRKKVGMETGSKRFSPHKEWRCFSDMLHVFSIPIS